MLLHKTIAIAIHTRHVICVNLFFSINQQHVIKGLLHTSKTWWVHNAWLNRSNIGKLVVLTLGKTNMDILGMSVGTLIIIDLSKMAHVNRSEGCNKKIIVCQESGLIRLPS